MMKMILSFKLLFWCALWSAQILIESNTNVSGEKFKLHISENSEHYFIILKIRDSISQNKEYLENSKILKQRWANLQDSSYANDSTKVIFKEIGQLAEQNTIYSSYQTIVKKSEQPEYAGLIDLFKTQPAAIFEQKEQNKNRVVFDGTLVKIMVEPDKIIWARSPSEISHPEIRQLLRKTLTLFSKNDAIPAGLSLSGQLLKQPEKTSALPKKH